MTRFMPLPEKPIIKKQVSGANRVSPKDCLRALQTSLRFLKGIGPKRAAQLEGLGLKTVEDLLYHLPFRYEDRRQLKKIRAATIGAEESFVGTLVSLEKKFIPRRRRSILKLGMNFFSRLTNVPTKLSSAPIVAARIFLSCRRSS